MADGVADTFAQFVDAVAESLDEDVDGDVLAARLHFSRPYVDRVITAAAGETPGRFRRRIRLERAAYRLLKRESTLLDIAVEAGYSSHEAFTRAFQRGYGVAPSVWRRDPGPPLLPSPTGVHFHPPGCLRLPASRKVTSMDLVVTMTEHHIRLIGEMLDRAGRLDDAALDTPIEVSVEGIDRDPTIRSLLSRPDDRPRDHVRRPPPHAGDGCSVHRRPDRARQRPAVLRTPHALRVATQSSSAGQRRAHAADTIS